MCIHLLKPTPAPAVVFKSLVSRSGSLTLRSTILSNLKPPVDGSNCAPAACHTLGNFEDGHIAIREEPHDSFYLLFGERTSLSSHMRGPSFPLFGGLNDAPGARVIGLGVGRNQPWRVHENTPSPSQDRRHSRIFNLYVGNS